MLGGVPAGNRLRSVVVLAAVAALAFVALKLLPSGTSSRASEPPGAGAPATVLQRPERGPALVHVAGAVRRPGVYRVAGDARVRDAVRRAGGARSGADLDAVNLAARVTDGEQVVVPSRAPGPAAAGGSQTGPAAPVSLGSASAEELDSLDGIGPVTAEKIVEWRTRNGGVGSVDELEQVPGIGPKTIESLRGQLTP